MVTIQQGLKADGIDVSMVKLCRWFEVARRSVYYRSRKAPPKVKAELAEPIKALIEAEPSFGYRTVAGLLALNKNTVQRIFQLKGWQVRKRALGSRPRIERSRPPSVRTSAGRRTCAGCGVARTVGWCWPWSSTVIPISCSAGIWPERGKRRQRVPRWNRP